MSNRILALLVLILFSVFAYFIYAYFFIYYNASIHISSNIENYKVNLYVKKIAKSFTYDCPQKECDIKDIAPFDYNMTLSKTWYQDDFRVIAIKKSSKNNLTVDFKKIVLLKNIEAEAKKEISKDAKIQLIKLKAWSYAFFELGEKWNYFFVEKWNSLSLNHLSPAWVLQENIGTFKKVAKDVIFLQAVLWDSDDIYIEIWDEKYIFSAEFNLLKKVDLGVKISYVKPWDKDKFLLVSDVGTYIFSFYQGTTEYFPLFFDFVAGEKKLIGYIKQDDSSRLKNFWLESEKQNIILEFDRTSLDKKVLLKSTEDIVKIYAKKGKIYAEESGGKVFELEGVENWK
jgi:hypothetical protein